MAKHNLIPYQNIFFDIDGTISDSYIGIENGIRFALSELGMPELAPNVIRNMIGIPLTESLLTYCSDDKEKITKAVQLFREYYTSKGIYESMLYAGVKDLLCEASKTYHLYTMTAKPTYSAIQLLEHLGVAQFFTEIKGYTPDTLSFKKADLVRSVSSSPNALVIGDKKQDIEAGKETGMKTCGVLYGYGTKEEIVNSNPDFIANTVMDLALILHI